MEDRDDWPAWGRLIDEARDRLHPTVSQNEAGRRLGMSGTNWRRVVQGRTGAMESPRGVNRLARMAQLVGVTPRQLEEVGRADAAKELRELLAERPAAPERSTALDRLQELVETDPAAARAIAELVEIIRRGSRPAEPERADEQRRDIG